MLRLHFSSLYALMGWRKQLAVRSGALWSSTGFLLYNLNAEFSSFMVQPGSIKGNTYVMETVLWFLLWEMLQPCNTNERPTILSKHN